MSGEIARWAFSALIFGLAVAIWLAVAMLVHEAYLTWRKKK